MYATVAPWTVVLGADGSIVTATPGARAQLAGRPLPQAIHPDDRAALVAAIQDALGGAPARTLQAAWDGPEGPRAAIWWIAPSDPGAIAVARDASRDAYQELIAAMRRARVEDLAPAVSHEVNNAMSAILANMRYLDVVRTGASMGTRRPDDLGSALDDATASAQRSSLVVSAQRLLARGEANGPSSVRTLVELAAALAAHPLRQRAQLIVEGNRVAPFQGHRGMFLQLMVELMLWCGAQLSPVSSVRSHIDETSVAIYPSGEPSGPPAAIPWAVPLLVTELGMELVARPGESLQLTLDPSPSAARPRLVVIDDNRIVAISISRLVSDHFEAEIVSDGEEALARLRAGPMPDVVLCDLVLPGMSGIDVYRAQPPELRQRFVFVSGGLFNGPTAKFLDFEGQPHLSKPFSIEQFLEAARPILGG